MKLLSVKCFATIPCWSRFRKLAKCPFALLARMIFMQRRRMKDLLPRVCVVNRTSNLNSLRSLADCVKKKKLLQRGCCKCSKIIFPASFNQSCYWSVTLSSLLPSSSLWLHPTCSSPHHSDNCHTSPKVFAGDRQVYLSYVSIFTRLLLWQRKYYSS